MTSRREEVQLCHVGSECGAFTLLLLGYLDLTFNAALRPRAHWERVCGVTGTGVTRSRVGTEPETEAGGKERRSVLLGPTDRCILVRFGSAPARVVGVL